ncbi:hypothetical protein GDO81_016996 [Engystomops pustulosus]|uniref:Endonuclease/exonuclease/phosphatase domain-containing protein n=1 Tax=Engystomops pustulosus TaxID=76066 RepID=A0AAV7AAR3_ENGPU|nr:hypothetical protein GDO81_016996 [Engystomops pustulosus]
MNNNLTRQMTKLALDLSPQIMVSGDVNQVMHLREDRSQRSHTDQPQIETDLAQLSSDLGLVDAWRHLHPEDREYSLFS